MLAVEIDPAWARVLRDRTAALDDVRVLRGDALEVRLPAEPFWAMSAAPYGIGTALVRRLLSDAHGLAAAAVVLQRETARRLAGRPRTGRFAATWAPWFELAVTRTIPAAAFRPRPSVESALLLVTPRRRPLLSPAAFGAYARFLDAPFGGRGRTLRDRLGPEAAAALAGTGVPRSATPSAVPPDVYASLFSEIAPRRLISLRRPRGAPQARREVAEAVAQLGRARGPPSPRRSSRGAGPASAGRRRRCGTRRWRRRSG